MTDDVDELAHRILRDYRHLMTESERKADRAFVFQGPIDASSDPAETARLNAAVQQSLADPVAKELFALGRERFLAELVRRILAEHHETLPRCGQCGGYLKTPHPKKCFDCDFGWEP